MTTGRINQVTIFGGPRAGALGPNPSEGVGVVRRRSEERRVGKECRL